MKSFQNLTKKAPKSGPFGQKSGGLFEFFIGGGLIKSGSVLAQIWYVSYFGHCGLNSEVI